MSKVLPEIEVNGKYVWVSSPYDRKFVEKARLLGGAWSAESSKWRFSRDTLDAVRAVVKEVYGVDPLDGAVELTNVKVVLAGRAGEELRFAGRRLLYRGGRDAAVTTGPDVVVTKGSFARSGGSARYPEIGDIEGVELLVRALPTSVVEALKGQPWVASVEEVTMSDKDKAAALADVYVAALASYLQVLPEAEADKVRSKLAAIILVKES